MAHTGLAHLAAVLGAGGSAAVLLAWGRRTTLVAGFAVLVAAEACLAVAIVPGHDLRRFESVKVAGALGVAAIVVAGVVALLVRRPALTAPLLLLAAPFRISVHLGSQHAFLLLPLYGMLAAAALAFLYRILRGTTLVPIPRLLALAAATFVGLDSVSLLWSKDVQQGSIELLFFLFPFAALVAVVAGSPFPRLRTLAATLVGLTSLFALIGLYERATRTLIYAPSLEVENTYTSYFRVSAVFKDPSLYGRYLAVGIAVVLVAHLFASLRLDVTVAILALLSAGLWFSYSQSSMVAIFIVTIALGFVAGNRSTRRAILVAGAVIVLAAGAFVAVKEHHSSARKLTSDRSRLISVTWTVFRHHPLVGVGVGAQPLASHEEAARRSITTRDKSHTTPLTVAAELGILGLAAYAFFLLSAYGVLRAAERRERAAGLGLAAVFVVLVVHSLFYAGFFEDPLTWGSLAVAASLLARARAGPSLTDALRPTTAGGDGTLGPIREPTSRDPART
jgi:O-antigen ligase